VLSLLGDDPVRAFGQRLCHGAAGLGQGADAYAGKRLGLIQGGIARRLDTSTTAWSGCRPGAGRCRR
jgi:hypothetical protein